MSRRTPAIATQVIPPYIRTNAYLKGRLIDFDTASFMLEGQHRDWLVQKVNYAKVQSDYRIWLIGYASKLGDTASNQHLSLARMNSVLRFMGTVDDRALSKVDSFMARGSGGYVAGATDNSADERAVEVHIFIGTPPPDDPPPDITPTPHPLPPLPGGKRYSKWAVAAPGGGVANIAPGIVIGFNIFVFRNDETGEKKAYISPQVGLGLSFSLKGGKLLFAVQTLLTSPAYSNMDFTKFTTDYPLTWAELGDAGVTVSSVGGGIGVIGGQGAYVTIDAPNVYRYSTAGTPIRKEMHLISFNASGKDYQLGAGASAVAGTLVLVAE
jgi:hypothetical protein